MLNFEEMLFRLGVSALMGIIIGLERETLGKEAGLKTNTLVAIGSTIFTLSAISLPYIISKDTNNLADVLARNSGFLSIIANIVVGIGFLGGGIMVKHGIHVKSITTAALIWVSAGIGVLCGIGLIRLALVTTFSIIIIVYLLMKLENKIKSLLPFEKEKNTNEANEENLS